MLDIRNRHQVDQHLSTGPFGSSSFLEANVELLYRSLSSIVGRHLNIDVPSPSASLPASARAIVRRELDFSFAELAEGRSVSNKSRWLQVIDAIKSMKSRPTHESVGPICVLLNWETDPFANDIRLAFSRSMKDEGAVVNGRRPAKKHIQMIHLAHELAQHTIPDTYFDSLSLAPNVVLVHGQVSSAYINENPFSFFINDSQFADCALTMETLLHEALHEKMACIRLTSNLLRAGYDDLDSETRGDVLVPWPSVNRPRYWSFARALAAYHVYVHTSALYFLLLQTPAALHSVATEDLLQRFKSQFERASYLHAALQSDWCQPYADMDAKDFFAWAGAVLEALERVRGDYIPAMQTWSYSEIKAAEDARRAA